MMKRILQEYDWNMIGFPRHQVIRYTVLLSDTFHLLKLKGRIFSFLLLVLAQTLCLRDLKEEKNL